MCTHPISGLFNSRGLLAKIVAKVTKVVKIVAKVSFRNYALILKKTPPPPVHTHTKYGKGERLCTVLHQRITTCVQKEQRFPK